MIQIGIQIACLPYIGQIDLALDSMLCERECEWLILSKCIRLTFSECGSYPLQNVRVLREFLRKQSDPPKKEASGSSCHPGFLHETTSSLGCVEVGCSAASRRGLQQDARAYQRPRKRHNTAMSDGKYFAGTKKGEMSPYT